jgi:phosphopantetheinyl transferase (holo-ACP synthase)
VPAGHGNLSVVGLFSWSELDDGDYLDCLSEREGHFFAGLRHLRRRQSWLAGRLVAKFCFLDSFGRVGARGPEIGRPRIAQVRAQDLKKFAPWMYRQIEIVTEHSRRGEPPRLVWAGRAREVSVSLSHADGQSCVYLDSGGPIGLDLEEALPRRDSFYRHNFSALEQAWVDLLNLRTGAASAWLFTLLWTLKEAALKTDDSGRSSLWRMRGLEVLLPAEAGDWACGSRRDSLGTAFSPVQARVRLGGTEHLFHVGIAGSTQRILSIIKRNRGNQNHEYADIISSTHPV